MQIDPDLGIGTKNRRRLAAKLGHLLADSYRLALKTQNFHWNVSGPMFHTLHVIFEEQYAELATAIDAIAERIRVLGHFAPGNFEELRVLSGIKDSKGIPSAMEMVQELIDGHAIAIRTARRALASAFDGNDEATTELVAARLGVHEKAVWMLKSLLDED